MSHEIATLGRELTSAKTQQILAKPIIDQHEKIQDQLRALTEQIHIKDLELAFKTEKLTAAESTIKDLKALKEASEQEAKGLRQRVAERELALKEEMLAKSQKEIENEKLARDVEIRERVIDNLKMELHSEGVMRTERETVTNKIRQLDEISMMVTKFRNRSKNPKVNF